MSVRVLLVIVLMAVGFSAQAKIQQSCGKFKTPSIGTWTYCLSPSSETNQLMIFFPGIWNKTDLWADEFNQSIASNIKKYGPMPTVLTVNAPNKTYFLSGNIQKSGMSDIEELSSSMLQLIIELKLPNISIPGNEALVYANSMGGHNFNQVFLRHPKWFKRIALACPANIKVSPFIGWDDWIENAKDEDGFVPLVVGLAELLKIFYKTDDNWQRNSPLKFLEKSYRAVEHPQPFYIVTVENDRFGFDKVQSIFASHLQRSGHSVQIDHYHKSHCFFDTENMGRFLSTGN